MTSPKTDLSIVIPAYQEAELISGTLHRLAAWLNEHDYGVVEVIVVVADSPDGTAALAMAEKQLFTSFRVIDAGAKVGKGRDVRLGIMAARGRYRLFMDADLATPLVHLDDVYRLMQTGADVGIAVRNLVRIHHQLRRRVISKIGNLLAQTILLPGIKDTQCGFKVFRADVAEPVFRRMTILGWGFDLEVLSIARSLGYQIETFEAADWTDPKAVGEGMGDDSAGGVALQTFRELLAIRYNLIRRRYR